ncbi:MAG: PASTA domain-containing protein [Actinobacteria bacterium]|nr:PASTA domain-containing protein [Actinomycetota bacterium]
MSYHPGVSESPPSSTATLLGGRYRVVEEIARGGMATVHRGVDVVLDRPVAIKIMHRHLSAEPTFLDRFLREARAAAGLSHLNVVAVYDWGHDRDDAYLVMEQVNGLSLRQVLRARGRLSPAETTAVLAPAAAGIAAAHRRGIVHRDVKPDNILVADDGVVKVTDFGLARAAATSTQTFAPGSLVGSPHYLAPEAVRDEQLDERADVYALGVVAYECLVGHPPFQADNAVATAVRHTRETVPAPSTMVEAAAALDEVVTTATAPDAADRYPDAAAFAAALRAAVPDSEVVATSRDPDRATVVIPPETTDTVVPSPAPADTDVSERPAPRRRPRQRPGRARRWVRKAVGALVLLALVAGGGYLAWDRYVAPVTPVPDVVQLSREDAVRELRESGFAPAIDDDSVFDRTIPADHVAAQDPTGDVRRGTTVVLTLSAGPPDVPGGVPEVVNVPAADAQATLEELHLVVEVHETYHEEVAEGLVIAVDPPPGTTIKEGASVALAVSRGRQPITVPGVVGDGEGEASAAVAADGLDPVVVDRVFSDEVPAGVVVDQRPKPGATAYRQDRVELVVSKGPQPFPMPEVRDTQRSDAVRMLEQLGLSVEVREQERIFGFGGRKDTVAKQDPDPGVTVRRGDRVTIYVWR